MSKLILNELSINNIKNTIFKNNKKSLNLLKFLYIDFWHIELKKFYENYNYGNEVHNEQLVRRLASYYDDKMDNPGIIMDHDIDDLDDDFDEQYKKYKLNQYKLKNFHKKLKQVVEHFKNIVKYHF